jgi:hypothetical protein
VVGVDDPHVVDRATASVAGSPGYAATRARGVYLEPAHLDDANEVDDVGVGVRDRRALRGIACVRVSEPTTRLAASPIRRSFAPRLNPPV